MPYQTIASLSDGSVLSAAHLNLIADNIEYLRGISSSPNTGFNTYRATLTTLTNSNAIWYVRHRNRYLHYKVTGGANWNYVRLFYNGVKFAANESSASSFSGYVDLETFTGCPNYQGTWATATSYSDNRNGDGDIVVRSGVNYRCKLSHTSAAASEPGTGASWTTYWDVLTLPALLTQCSMWITSQFGSSQTITVEYLIESDGTSI